MNLDLNQIDFFKVALWVIIVLVAGFIGQFGKSFARHLIDRFRKKPDPALPPQTSPTAKMGPPATQIPPEASSSPSISADESKARKKELKADLKKRKKESK